MEIRGLAISAFSHSRLLEFDIYLEGFEKIRSRGVRKGEKEREREEGRDGRIR